MPVKMLVWGRGECRKKHLKSEKSEPHDAVTKQSWAEKWIELDTGNRKKEDEEKKKCRE